MPYFHCIERGELTGSFAAFWGTEVMGHRSVVILSSLGVPQAGAAIEGAESDVFRNIVLNVVP